MKKILLPAIVLSFLTGSLSAFSMDRRTEGKDMKTLYKMCRFPQTFGFQIPIEDLAIDCHKTELNWRRGEVRPMDQMGDDSIVIRGTLFAKKRYMSPNDDALNSSGSKDEPYFQSMGRSTLRTLAEVTGISMGGQRVQWEQVETEYVGQGTISCLEFIDLFNEMGQDQNMINQVCSEKFNVNWYPSKSGTVVKTLVL